MSKAMANPGGLSTRVRLAYVGSAIALCTLMGGAVYGWPTMRAILRRDGVLLPEECRGLAEAEACDQQELSFGLVFTIGSWSNQGGRFFVGIALDRYGPRRTSATCAALCCLGALLFGAMESVVGLSAGFFLIGVGGAGMQLSLQSVSALFPQNRALVMSTLSGAFQAASGVFLIMDALHRNTRASRQMMLFVWASVIMVATIFCALIWPSRAFGIKKAEAHGTGFPAAETSVVPVVPLADRSFRQQAFSPEYIIMVGYFSLAVLQAQFTIGTVGMQFELMGDSSGALTQLFGLFFSMSWIATPFIGHIIDRLGVPNVLALMNTLLLCCSLLLMSKSLVLQPILGIVYSLARVSIWASFFTFIGSTFGFAHFGKLAGFGLLVASCLSLLQFCLLTATLEQFHRDFLYVNAFFVVLCIFMYPLLGALRYHLQKPHHREPKLPKVVKSLSADSSVVAERSEPDQRDLEKDAAAVQAANNAI